MKTAVVLFNLGGPSQASAIEPFLRNLFCDPAILPMPALVRFPLAWLIARKRAGEAKKNYAILGGSSPLLKNTKLQAEALSGVLGTKYRVFVSMRYASPYSSEVVEQVKAYGADRIVLLPLYPQFSTTTTASSFLDWDKSAKKACLNIPTARISSYPVLNGFIEAMALLATPTCAQTDTRFFLTAHGLPQRIVDHGDPYPEQIMQTAQCLADRLKLSDWVVTYQSRVGPVKWLEPATDAEIQRAGKEGKSVVLVPIAFVSEHSETLVELDVQYGELAKASGVCGFHRVPTVGTHSAFIEGLADLVRTAF